MASSPAPPLSYFPVPVSITVCELPSVSSTLIVALRAPVAVGVKVTVIVHWPWAARVAGAEGQLLVWAKSPGSVPVMMMLVILNALLPTLVNFTVLLRLVVPTACEPKVRRLVDKVTSCGVGMLIGPPPPAGLRWTSLEYVF